MVFGGLFKRTIYSDKRRRSVDAKRNFRDYQGYRYFL